MRARRSANLTSLMIFYGSVSFAQKPVSPVEILVSFAREPASSVELPVSFGRNSSSIVAWAESAVRRVASLVDLARPAGDQAVSSVRGRHSLMTRSTSSTMRELSSAGWVASPAEASTAWAGVAPCSYRRHHDVGLGASAMALVESYEDAPEGVMTVNSRSSMLLTNRRRATPWRSSHGQSELERLPSMWKRFKFWWATPTGSGRSKKIRQSVLRQRLRPVNFGDSLG